ALPHMAKRLYS
ncbi:hypothetical protein D027_1902B, partial [Vibrio parahaemolyticus 861]